MMVAGPQHLTVVKPQGSPEEGMSPLLSVRNVSLSLKGQTILDRVSLDVEEGRFVSLIGPNGAGKTTLIRVLLQLQAAEGEVLLAGRRLSQGQQACPIGYVPQQFQFNLSFPLTVEEFLYMSLRPRFPWWFKRNWRHDLISETLHLSDACHLLHKLMGKLSGGELQRVLLAQALLQKPRILVLDEPSSALDVNAQAQFFEQIHRLNREQGMTIFLCTHDLAMVFKYSDEVICLQKSVICHGTPDAIRQDHRFLHVFGLE